MEFQPPLPADEVGRRRNAPTPDQQLARAEYGLAWHLHQGGQTEAAERHFARADQLAPDDFTIRRGGLKVYPRLAASQPTASNHIELASSGVVGLDALLGGGLVTGTSTLLIGPAGSAQSG